MIVITLSDCPAALRGDLTKWLQEINTGVYAGHVSARVREEIWKRVQKSIKSGRATMAFSANTEQRMDFRVHNTDWEPIDFDGLKLMMRPNQVHIKEQGDLRTGFSNAARIIKAKQMSGQKRGDRLLLERYVIVDIETTGLSQEEHEIIEIGAILVSERQIKAEYHSLVKAKASIPSFVQTMTGITDDHLGAEGQELVIALTEFLTFVGDLSVVSHNVDFEYNFLRAACDRCGLPLFSNPCIDTVVLAQRLVDDVSNYKLETLAVYFGIKTEGIHRSIADCLIIKQLYEKLMQLRQTQE